MYAVLETGGKQYRVSPGDQLSVERLEVNAGEAVTFDRVFMVSDDSGVKTGNPVLEQAKVVADVLEHKRGPKILVFKMRRRHGYRKTQGHRQDLTVIKIKEITA